MGTPDAIGRSTTPRDEVFDALADERRRAALRVVHDQSPAGVEKDDLAVELAAVTADKPPAEVTDDEHRRAFLECHHRTVPILTDAGLLAETNDGTLVAGDAWATVDFDVGSIVDGPPPGSDADLDAAFEALADSRRRTALAVLANQCHPMATEDLARAVAARETGSSERDVSPGRLERVTISLVHTHLPRLRDAGLVECDAETERISFDGHPVVRVVRLEDGSAWTSSETVAGRRFQGGVTGLVGSLTGR